MDKTVVDMIAQVGLPGVIALYVLVRLDRTIAGVGLKLAELTNEIRTIVQDRKL